MVNNVHNTVEDCSSGAQDGPQMKHKGKLQLLRAAGTFEFLAIDIIGRKTTSGIQQGVL